MKRLQKPPVGKTKEKKQEPLAEGLQITVATGPNGNRLWRKMSDAEIVGFAQKFMEEEGLNGRRELQNADCGLYNVLRKRKLLGEVGLEKKVESWRDMSNEEIVEFAQKLVEEREIANIADLSKIHPRVHSALRRRGLIRRIKFEEKRRSWKEMSDEEIVEIARKLMEQKGMAERTELSKFDYGLYQVLAKRKLLDDVGFVQKRKKKRSWKNMDDAELVEFAYEFVEKNEICGRKELSNADSGLYEILRIRGLLDQAFGRVDQQRNERARDAVIDALTEFAATDEKPEVGVA